MLCWIHFRKHENEFVFSVISQHWDGTYCWLQLQLQLQNSFSDIFLLLQDEYIQKYIYKYVRRLLLRYVHTTCIGATQKLFLVKDKNQSGPFFTNKTPSYAYRNPHYKLKTVWCPSQVYDENYKGCWLWWWDCPYTLNMQTAVTPVH